MYVKMTLTLFALWAPPRVLHAARRGAFLFFFDAFGKWSFFDVLLLHLLMAGLPPQPPTAFLTCPPTRPTLVPP